MLFLCSKPEATFAKAVVDGHAELFDSVLKSPDRGFYQVPYSYKPTDKGTSHVQRENFNPDFILKVNGQNRLLIVEIKEDNDSDRKNQAKHRDATAHFRQLNAMLNDNGIDWTYHFYFLSPEDYSPFFQAIRDGNWAWQSQLMQQLEGGGMHERNMDIGYLSRSNREGEPRLPCPKRLGRRHKAGDCGA